MAATGANRPARAARGPPPVARLRPPSPLMAACCAAGHRLVHEATSAAIACGRGWAGRVRLVGQYPSKPRACTLQMPCTCSPTSDRPLLTSAATQGRVLIDIGCTG